MSISPEQEELKKKAMEYQKQQEEAAAEAKVRKRRFGHGRFVTSCCNLVLAIDRPAYLPTVVRFCLLAEI